MAKTNFEKCPSNLVISLSFSFLAKSLKGWSYSFMYPSSNTNNLSQSMIVASLLFIRLVNNFINEKDSYMSDENASAIFESGSNFFLNQIVSL